jgi:hypothetical protein
VRRGAAVSARQEPKPHRSEEIILDAGTLLVRPGIGQVLGIR